MVKKKGKSKRTTLKDKYRIQRRIVETHRKRKKQTKKDAASGVIRHSHQSKKDPGIPNSWPFKQDLLKDIQRTRERQQAQQDATKDKRQSELRALREHQEAGGTARTVEELLMQRAASDQQAFDAKQQREVPGPSKDKSDGTQAAGQPSRRAYLRELKKVVDSADVLLQVLDARDPVQSRIHKVVEDVVLSHADKRMVLVLNKIDLVPPEAVGAWLTVLRRSHPTIAMAASSQNHQVATQVTVDALLQLLKNYARNGTGKNKTVITVGVIGYPNTGKSSIINALKRTRAVSVSSKPGHTVSMQEVVLDRNVRLLDSPGVVFDDRAALLGNCVDGERLADPVPAVQALLRRCDHSRLQLAYGLPHFDGQDTMQFLALVAKSMGRVLKGGVPDKVAAARNVLRDWNTGKIPYYTVPPLESQTVKSNDAVIVSGFGEEFDLSKVDDVVMQSLEKRGRDEVDYVPLQQDEVMDTENSRATVVTASFLSGQGDDSDDSDDNGSMEVDSNDEDDREDEQDDPQRRLAEAEDYDFNDM